MRGGIIKKNQAVSAKSTFYHFVKNSVCTLITKDSKGGFLFKLTLDSSIESPYVLNRSNSPHADVRELIIKLVFLNDTNGIYAIRKNGAITSKLSNTIADEFMSECGIQNHVFTNTLDVYLEPICPSIVLNSLNLGISELFILFESAMKSSDQFTKDAFQQIMATIVPPKTATDPLKLTYNGHLFDVGLIVMENLSGFDTLYNINKTNHITRDFNKKLAILELYRLFNLNILHGDFHENNFMINPAYEYIDGQPGRVIIIDFGASFPHNYPRVDPSNMMQVIDYYYSTEIPNFEVGTAQNHPYYQWLRVPANDYPAWNIELKALWDAREIKKSQFVAHVASASASASVTITVGGTLKNKTSLYKNKFNKYTFNKYTFNKYTFNKNKFNKQSNVFNKLDPNNVFTMKFIKKYINDELRNLNGVGGLNKKSKKTRNKKFLK
jgi:hypothetical protein